MNIQQLEHSDLDFLKEFQPPEWPDIFPSLHFYLNSSFCHPLKIISGNTIVGIGTTILHRETAWLAAIIVHPDHRNKGIGRIITQTLVDSLKKSNCKTISLVATELGEPIYKKEGFVTETEYAFFNNEGSFDKNFTSTSGITRFDEKYKNAILSLDRKVSGENRRVMLEGHLEGSLVYTEENNVAGYYLPTFGEGLIIANHAKAGIELMKLRLTTKDKAVLPVDNKPAITFLLDHHFKEFRKAKRMRLGKKITFQPQNMFNRIGGQIG